LSDLLALCDEIAACQRCDLAKGRLKTVPGEGAARPDILFIGEAPGWHENQQGRPFVGPAGHLLDELLASIGLQRRDVYIANVVKCRPPNNRDPLPVEIDSCAPFLDRQIALLQPKLIVTLGRFSMATFFPGESIGKIHGRPARKGDIVVLPMYHPAAALHQPSLRKVIEEDMKVIPRILASIVSAPLPELHNDPTQLSLF